MARQQLSILNIGGHPKDAILYAGGTMAKHVALGDRVCTLTPTHGLSHHLKAIEEATRSGRQPDLDALIKEREQEFVEAAGELGVTDVRFLGHDDEIVLLDRAIISEIRDVICEVRPDIIITHNPYDSVPTHASVTQMTLLALDAAAHKLGSPHSVKQVYYHTQMGDTNVLESSLPRIPTTVIDITDVIHKKANAMNRFTSQYYGDDSPLQRKLGEVLDSPISGIHLRVPYAEAFVAHYPEVFDSLPLSEYGMKLSRKSMSETYEYMSQMLLDT